VFDHKGTRAFVTAEQGGSITVVDAPVNAVLKIVPVGDSTKPTGVAVSPNGKTVYFANGRANYVAVFSTAAMTVTDTIPVGKRPWGVALSPDGSTLYTADGRSNQVSVVDVIHKKVVTTIPVGERPYGTLYLATAK
ncbi:MAG TPA: beta-propeller fold lactonase family protein, partial [Gemmatimonadaceae bacterium]|nr:beta-propeller fold lactonase family protein [Gemmatimonadaceae bacterium]